MSRSSRFTLMALAMASSAYSEDVNSAELAKLISALQQPAGGASFNSVGNANDNVSPVSMNPAAGQLGGISSLSLPNMSGLQSGMPQLSSLGNSNGAAAQSSGGLSGLQLPAGLQMPAMSASGVPTLESLGLAGLKMPDMSSLTNISAGASPMDSLGLAGLKMPDMSALSGASGGVPSLESLGLKMPDMSALSGTSGGVPSLESLGLKMPDMSALSGTSGGLPSLESLGLKMPDMSSLSNMSGLQLPAGLQLPSMSASGVPSLESLGLAGLKLPDMSSLSGMSGLPSLESLQKSMSLESLTGSSGSQGNLMAEGVTELSRLNELLMKAPETLQASGGNLTTSQLDIFNNEMKKAQDLVKEIETKYGSLPVDSAVHLPAGSVPVVNSTDNLSALTNATAMSKRILDTGDSLGGLGALSALGTPSGASTPAADPMASWLASLSALTKQIQDTFANFNSGLVTQTVTVKNMTENNSANQGSTLADLTKATSQSLIDASSKIGQFTGLQTASALSTTGGGLFNSWKSYADSFKNVFGGGSSSTSDKRALQVSGVTTTSGLPVAAVPEPTSNNNQMNILNPNNVLSMLNNPQQALAGASSQSAGLLPQLNLASLANQASPDALMANLKNAQSALMSSAGLAQPSANGASSSNDMFALLQGISPLNALQPAGAAGDSASAQQNPLALLANAQLPNMNNMLPQLMNGAQLPNMTMLADFMKPGQLPSMDSLFNITQAMDMVNRLNPLAAQPALRGSVNPAAAIGQTPANGVAPANGVTPANNVAPTNGQAFDLNSLLSGLRG